MNITPNARIILEKTFIQGYLKCACAYIRRKRIAQTVANDASRVTKKIISETAWRSITDAVYSARYHSQCWFISCSLHSTCETCYGRQLGRASRILKRRYAQPHASPSAGSESCEPLALYPQNRSTMSGTFAQI